jgi:alpha-ketoglutarate-dependent taurine dioxygenase
MHKLFGELTREGFGVLKHEGEDTAELAIHCLSEAGFPLLRDVMIGMGGDPNVDLTADGGDFWFHTDGVFLRSPPRWIAIFLKERQLGGDLQVLSSLPIACQAPHCEVRFGSLDSGVTSAILTAHKGKALFRYRSDYMFSSPEDQGILHAFDQLLRSHAETAAMNIDGFSPGDCLIVDNWTLLHRRRAFSGRRVIRRLWFGERK